LKQLVVVVLLYRVVFLTFMLFTLKN